jgi:Flp pilus assembly protein TadG
VIFGWLLKLVTALVLLGFVAVEAGSPLVTKATLDGAAHNAADDAAHEYFQSRDTDKAKAAAAQDATDDHAQLQNFSIDDQGVVHVTLYKKARSFVLDKFSQTKDWYNVHVSASATPK